MKLVNNPNMKTIKDKKLVVGDEKIEPRLQILHQLPALGAWSVVLVPAAVDMLAADPGL